MEKKETNLSESQKLAYELLVSTCDYSLRRGTICLIGDFQSGKTTLVKHFLLSKFGNIDRYYLNVNLYLLERLRQENSDMSIMTKIKAKTRLIMTVAIQEALEKYFDRENLMVMDAIEMLYPYNLDLISLVSRYTRDGKVCIVCVPENDKFVFNFSLGNCDIVRLESRSENTSQLNSIQFK
jgi:GTPase SAR1 family protein